MFTAIKNDTYISQIVVTSGKTYCGSIYNFDISRNVVLPKYCAFDRLYKLLRKREWLEEKI